MRKVWILVANSSTAKIYHAVNVQKLEEKQSFEHFESHLKREDLVSDNEGGATYSFGSAGVHSMPEKTPQKVKERHAFAEQIAAYLEQGHQSKEFEHLYIIANPTFLGHLRSSLSHNLIKTIISEVHKDLTLLKPNEIRDYLPPVL